MASVNILYFINSITEVAVCFKAVRVSLLRFSQFPIKPPRRPATHEVCAEYTRTSNLMLIDWHSCFSDRYLFLDAEYSL